MISLRSTAAIVCSLAACLSLSQSSVPSTNPLQAIINARIEVGDGRVIEKGNVVMRDGIIVAVGPEIEIPAGAETFDATGMTVYPGFIDAYTNRGMNLPEDQAPIDPQRPEYARAFMLETGRKGISAHLLGGLYYAPTRDFLTPYWNAGFTAANLAPPGYIGGQNSLVSLSERPARDSFIGGVNGLTISFSRVTGPAYPASLLGAIAQIRQAMSDAQWYAALDQSYAAGGTTRPPLDQDLYSIFVKRGEPTFFEASTTAEIDRAIAIGDEFGYQPVIVGGAEAWKRSAVISARALPVVVALAFGREPGLKPETPEPPNKGDDPVDADEMPEKTAERKRVYLENVNNAAELARRNIPFAFTTRGTRNQQEFMDNLRRAIKEGLTRADALKALTINPANLLAVGNRLGTIEANKIANLTVMSGDFVEPKTKVKMLFVDGIRIDPAASQPQAQPRGRRGEGDDQK